MTAPRIGRRGFTLAAASTLAALTASKRAAGRSTQDPAKSVPQDRVVAGAVASIDPIQAAVQHKARLATDLARDETRLPERILNFFQIKPGQQIADLQAGDGYYGELMARVTGPSGKVYCTNNSRPQQVFGKALTARLERKDLGAKNIVRVDRELDDLQIPGPLDRALLVRFYHDLGWMEVDRPAFNKMVFELLKPGAIFGVVDHHAKEGAGMSEGSRLHRVEASLVKKEVEAAGFKLEAESYVLNDPSDARDFNIFANNAARRDRTDRFVYLFRKPE